MVLYDFCVECGKVVDEFEKECGWCKKLKNDEKLNEKINLDNYNENEQINKN